MTSRTRTLWTFAITSAALFMVVLDNPVVTTALPTIQRSLAASIQELEWTVNAYTLTFAVLLLTGAALGDRFGRRRMFVTGLAVFTASSAAAALAPDVQWLIAARAAQGFGGAMVLPLTLTLLSDAVPVERRGLALGFWSAISGLGVAIGPLVGGAVVEGISWQVDLLAERPDRAGRAAAGGDPPAREPRPRPLPGHPRAGTGQRRAVRDRVGAGARQ
jgi:MFS family permease